MALKYEELQAMTDAELKAQYNEIATNTSVGLEWYREELRSRHLDRSERTLRRLTWFTALLAVANVVLVAATLID